jgi:hypothetical protein
VPFQQPFPLEVVQGSSTKLVHLFHFVFSQCDDTKDIAAVFEGRYNVGFRECQFCDCQDCFLCDIACNLMIAASFLLFIAKKVIAD